MKRINLKKYQRVISKKNGSAVVAFLAGHCGASAMMKNILSELERERRDFRFYYLDADAEKLDGEGYAAMIFPYVVFFKSGVKTGELRGTTGKNKIEKFIG